MPDSKIRTNSDSAGSTTKSVNFWVVPPQNFVTRGWLNTPLTYALFKLVRASSALYLMIHPGLSRLLRGLAITSLINPDQECFWFRWASLFRELVESVRTFITTFLASISKIQNVMWLISSMAGNFVVNKGSLRENSKNTKPFFYTWSIPFL